jgi:acyl dehydratase
MTATIMAAIGGAQVGPLTQTLDARWLMAYAAGLGERDPRYYDTRAPSGPLAHPLFPVCYEWPAVVALRDATLAPEVQPRGVHATHQLVIHRRPRAGDTLATTARVLGVESRRAGVLVMTRFVTVDAEGRPVTTTDYGSVYRGVTLQGPDDAGPPAGAPAAASTAAARAAADDVRWLERVEVASTAGHVYTECARIWNPIHTDLAVAQRAGLAGPILHGTATLALAVSRVVARDLDGDAARVREVRGRFTGMVPMPSTFTVRGRRGDGGGLAFDAVAPDGAPVLSQGVLLPCDR